MNKILQKEMNPLVLPILLLLSIAFADIMSAVLGVWWLLIPIVIFFFPSFLIGGLVILGGLAILIDKEKYL